MKSKVLIRMNKDTATLLEKEPYQTKMPFNLNIDEKYKFTTDVWLDNSLTVQSGKALEKGGKTPDGWA